MNLLEGNIGALRGYLVPTKLQVSTLFKGVRETYIRVPSSTTRDSLRHKMEKSGNFLPGSKTESERRYCESPTTLSHPFFFLPHPLSSSSFRCFPPFLPRSPFFSYFFRSPRRSSPSVWPRNCNGLCHRPGTIRGQTKISSLPGEVAVDLSSRPGTPKTAARRVIKDSPE